MKKNYILFAFLCFSLHLFAQNDEPFVPIGATWSYFYEYGSLNAVQPAGTPKINKSKCVKDTLIMGKKCSVINIDYTACSYFGKTVYMYRENKKVFIWNKNEFVLVYDFSKDKVNDSWETAFIAPDGKKETVYFSTQKVDTLTLYNGKKLRQFTLNIGTDAKNIKYKGVELYENIGFRVHILPTIMGYQACDDIQGTPLEFLCYEDKNVGLLKFTYRGCDDLSQPFVPVGATWTYAYRYFEDNKINILKSTCTKDTVIMGKKCSEIKVGYSFCYYLGTPIYMYKENKKVFIWNKSNFELLYDFNQDKFEDYWTTSLKNNVKGADPLVFSTQSVDFITLANGRKIRQFTVNIGSWDQIIDNKEPYKNVKIYENIGLFNHILPYALASNTCDDFGGSISALHCYEDKNVGLMKFREKDCNELSYVFAPAGATWTYSYKSSIPPSNTFPKSRCFSDTLILGKECSKIKADYNTCSPYGNPFFLSNEGDKTYLLNNGKFTLLYDFSNLKKGATWKFAYAYAAVTPIKYDTIQFVVEDITVMKIMFSYVTKLNVSLQRRDANGEYKTYYKGDLYRNIGFNRHILPPTNLFPCDDTQGSIEELRCYSGPNGSNPINFTSKKCESTSSLSDGQEQFEVSVFPNPSSGTFYINLQNVDFQRGHLHIFNQQGKKILTQSVASSVENQSIDLKNAANGLYFWQLEIDGQLVKNGKIVVMK
jgi:Secretion system C-terminal sorting domain